MGHVFSEALSMVTGYGSKQGFKAVKVVGDKEVPCSTDSRCTVIARAMLNHMRNPNDVMDDELAVLGLVQRREADGSLETDANGRVIIRSKLTGRLMLAASVINTASLSLSPCRTHL